MKYNTSVLYGFIVVCFCLNGALAAPSVKRFGTAGAGNLTNTTSLAGTTTSSGTSVERVALKSAPTVRLPSSSGISASTNKLSDSSRITVGKYVNSGLSSSGSTIKPVAPSNKYVDVETFSDLTDRVSVLESDISEKQNVLSMGDGIVLENDEISLNPDITDKINKLELQIDKTVLKTDLENGYYTKTEIETILDDKTTEESKTIFDSATGARKYVSIVDTFKEEILN